MDACSSFIKAGKFTAQGWAQLFTDMEESGMNPRAWAKAHDGEVIVDEAGKAVQVLKFETVNKYFGLINWAMRNLVNQMDEDIDEGEVTVLDVLAEFTYITEIERVKNAHKAHKAVKSVRASDPVAYEAKRIQKMTPAQQKALRKQLGW
jgi:methyl coenzyme M reductase gamma subunit